MRAEGHPNETSHVPQARPRAEPLRPGDYARLALAGPDTPARARARDQQADVFGETLRRRVLYRLAALDPEPDALAPTLLAIATELGEPPGPARAICMTIHEEWAAAAHNEEFLAYLIDQAMRAGRPRLSETQGEIPAGPSSS
jgi:hypothetical protein